MWENMGIIALVVFGVGGWVITDVVKAISSNWRRRHESEHLAALKQSMVERGMPAEEIVRVAEAGVPTKPPTDGDEHLAGLISEMMKNGKSTEDIERIVHAWHGRTKSGENWQVRAGD